MRVNPSQRSGLPQDFLGVAIDGPTREGFYFAPAYRVHGDGRGQAAGKGSPYIYPDGAARAWSLEYSPSGAGRRGRITVRLDGRTVRQGGPGDRRPFRPLRDRHHLDRRQRAAGLPRRPDVHLEAGLTSGPFSTAVPQQPPWCDAT
jgi:hypothetical protein